MIRIKVTYVLAEKFLQTARIAAQNDLHLNSDQATDSITATLAAHERKFEELQQKWQSWQNRRQSFRIALQTVEEIQMWQVGIEYQTRN